MSFRPAVEAALDRALSPQCHTMIDVRRTNRAAGS